MAYTYRGKIRDVSAPALMVAQPAPEKHYPQAPAEVFDATKCGTTYGLKQHRKFKSAPCQPCRDADNAYHRDYRAKLRQGWRYEAPAFSTDKCGTMAGYKRHMKHRVPTCRACKDAHAAQMNDYNARRRATA